MSHKELKERDRIPASWTLLVHARMYVCMYVRTYVRMYVCMYVCVNRGFSLDMSCSSIVIQLNTAEVQFSFSIGTFYLRGLGSLEPKGAARYHGPCPWLAGRKALLHMG